MEKEEILGNFITKFNYEQLKQKIISHLSSGQKIFIAAMNPEKILKAKKDKKFQMILREADYLIPDGIGIVIASKFQKGNIKERITGIDCMMMLCELAIEKNYKVFLYGSLPNIVRKVKYNLEKRFSNINITGYLDGYVENNDKVIDIINSSEADIVFVALGSPKQEYWISNNIKMIKSKVFIGVGGSFDVLSGKIKRAPKWMQRIGLEWGYRLFKEPKRIFRQIKLFEFILLLLRTNKRKTRED